jgi:uncharacterized metal-binding protein
MYKRLNLKLIYFSCLIENEIWAQKHVIWEFIALCTIPFGCEFHHYPA